MGGREGRRERDGGDGEDGERARRVWKGDAKKSAFAYTFGVALRVTLTETHTPTHTHSPILPIPLRREGEKEKGECGSNIARASSCTRAPPFPVLMITLREVDRGGIWSANLTSEIFLPSEWAGREGAR